MDQNKLNVLLIEDDEDDYVMIRALLSEAFPSGARLEWVDTYEGGLEAIRRRCHDICLLDYFLGEGNGLDLLRQASGEGMSAPVILLTGQGGYELDIEAMKAGVADYLSKRTIEAPILERSIRYSIERKRTETRMRRLNRALKVLNECNCALVHEGEESRLLHRICRLIVEHGGYEFAWIGFTEDDNGKSVEPVARYGRLGGFMDAPGLAQAVEGGRPGASGAEVMLFRSGVSRDLDADADCSPSDADEPGRGFVASIALALTCGEEAFGKLSIHAADPNAFDDEEMALLLELADNLSYGITALRTREGRRQAEEALRKSERYFRSLLTQMQEHICVIDRDYGILDVNKRSVDFIGLSRGEIVGRHCYEAFHGGSEPCSQAGKMCPLEKVFEDGLSRKERRERVKPDGTKVWADTIFSPLRDDQGWITHVIKSDRDATHEVKLESQLMQAQKMQAVRTLAGGIAHDFNNILGIILGYAEVMLFDVPEGSPLHDNLKKIVKAGYRATDLVQQILAFSRKRERERKPLRMGPFVKEALKLLRAVLPSTLEIRASLEMKPGEDVVMADATQVHQVIMNLCTNAGHAMRDKGGILQAGLSVVELGPGDAPLYPGLKPGKYVRLEVSDTGQGIDPAILDRIFDPYFTTKEVGEGAGLGLSVVHGIAESHGGTVTVYSEPGQGASFHVYFPQISAESSVHAERAVSPPVGNERILLIDDEPQLLLAEKEVLERLGYRVTAVQSGGEGLEAFKAKPNAFDLVISDQTMPKMTGLELAKELIAVRPDVPVVLCTGYSAVLSEITSEKLKSLGVREFLFKPFIMNEVAGLLRRLLDESPSRTRDRFSPSALSKA